ncbi:MAG: GHKL domain-containing protein [Bacteroidales bacterium]|nr:GHKL domain-containing protein [Bacteroidales bacterium]
MEINIPQNLNTRDGREEIPLLQADINLIYRDKCITSLLDSLPVITLLINKYRQILYCNRAYLELGASDPKELVLGLRPGEFFGCAHHNDSKQGCGESEHCRYCGAVAAIREAQASKEKATKEARITILKDNQEFAVDFKVTAAPFEFSGSQFFIYTIEDISDQKRRKILERVFFHDIIDKASSLQYAAELAESKLGAELPNKQLTLVKRLGQEIVSEIMGQRILMQAENNEFKLSISKASSHEIIQRSVEQIKNHNVAEGKQIIVSGYDNYWISTDYLLLNRVLVNMLKNALEGSKKNDIVTIKCYPDGQNVVFSVHNKLEISKEVKEQIFHRSFSTKGTNRGIGTYSMKLYGEQYLSGKVWFESDAHSGTYFYLSIPKELKQA